MDQEQIQVLLKRSNKLSELRRRRLGFLKAVDHKINCFVLNGCTDEDKLAWSTYRQALLDATNPYKDHLTNPEQATALDELNLNTFSWPQKPSEE
jgi:hypothetical protein